MTARPAHAGETYRDAMLELGLGHALYEPEPYNYNHIRVGDVGYVERGSFRRLYNACFDEDDKANMSATLPDPFIPLEPASRGVDNNRRLDAGIRRSRAIKASETSAGASVSNDVYVPPTLTSGHNAHVLTPGP